MSQPYESVTYEDIVRTLPVPSWGKSERFIRYLTQAHSWYKLPVDAGRPFFLFLDPSAGCALENRGEKGWGPVEITKLGHPTHGSQTTAQYRERFGFWSYAQALDNGEWGAFGPPHIQLFDGRKYILPADYLDAGRVRLNAFVYPDASFAYLGGLQRFSKWPAESVFDRMRWCLQERLASRPRRLKELLEEEIPAEFRDGLKPSDDEIGLHFPNPGFLWPDAKWKRRARGLDVPEKYWSPLCKYFELLAQEKRLCRMPSSPGFPDHFLAMAAAEERVAQLMALTDAMASFLRKIAAAR